jgi:hypothetical protein
VTHLTTLRILLVWLAALGLAGCGSGASRSTTAPTDTGLPATDAARLTFFDDGEQMGEIVLHRDGRVEAVAGAKVARGRLADDELILDGEVIARRDRAGAITVRHDSREVVDGQVVHAETIWEPIGAVGEDGVFRAATGGHVLRIADGKLVGLPDGMTVDVALAEPARAGDAILLVVAFLAASSSVSESSGGKVESAEPAPPPPGS